MDDFVREKLTEWGFSDWIEKFEDEGIDKESLECLEEKEIECLFPKVGPRAKFKTKLKTWLKEKESSSANELEETVNFSQVESLVSTQKGLNTTADTSTEAPAEQVQPFVRDTRDNGKRRLDQGECSKPQTPAKRQCSLKPGSYTDEIIRSGMKDIMRCVYERIGFEEKTKVNGFVRTKISELETDKRELVGVFGRSGAGKSSLINAIIGEKELLPCGSISACTTVIIKVEANTRNSKYEAEIEFITVEEWKDELWSLCRNVRDNEDQEEEDDYDTDEKLSALYGEEWKTKSAENLLDNKYFREIPEFLIDRKKILTCESAKELSAKFFKYTRKKDGEYKGVRQWYWPLVKCVTVKVPGNHFLQHVTLVDLPGTGDINKSRDEMWKGLVRNCSTVWIVTDINRAATEKDAWEILECASSFIGNGGECQQIHFICTKSDLFEDSDDHSAAAICAHISAKNMTVKAKVKTEFNKQKKIKKHFSEECFKVFTVSSKEFLKGKYLQPQDTEIPQLQEFLQNLNDDHSETLNYVSRARGILSLIQGARSTNAPVRRDVCSALEEKMRCELEKIRESMKETQSAFEKCLSEGVEKSENSCEEKLRGFLNPRRPKNRNFQNTLKCVVERGGIHKPQKRKLINLNLKLSSFLTDSIDEQFRKTFPNDGKYEPFNGIIDVFSLDAEKLIQQFSEVELLLTFIKTEEEKIKTKLIKIIRERKKTIYSSLMETIEDRMQQGYIKAAGFKRDNMLNNMRATLQRHLHDSKDVMFKQAKNVMMQQLKALMEEIVTTLEKTLNEAIDVSLKTKDFSIPDFSKEFELVKQYCKELTGSPDP